MSLGWEQLERSREGRGLGAIAIRKHNWSHLQQLGYPWQATGTPGGSMEDDELEWRGAG